MPSMQHQSISISYTHLEKMTEIQKKILKKSMNCLLGWFHQSMSKKIKKTSKYALLLLLSQSEIYLSQENDWTPNFYIKFLLKKVWMNCQLRLILSEHVENDSKYAILCQSEIPFSRK